MLPYNILEIVHQIKVNESSTGTCFTILKNDKPYLITARHVVSNATKIDINMEAGWEVLDFQQIIFPDNPEVDIAAILIDNKYLKALKFISFKYTTDNLVLAGDSYFFGYPYNLQNNNVSTMTRGAPIIKKAIVAGDAYDTQGNSIGFLLDGHNNPGFSGGPCLAELNTKEWSIFGVTSSYVQQQEVLYDKNGKERMILFENSGIINSHSIDAIISKL